MKKTTIFAFACLLGITAALAQNKSPRVEASSKNIKVAYGQPSKRERVIFGPGGLEPYGKVWRTGA
nr:DUF2911 domain-containing protein [Cytophagales bacterium]